MLSVSNPVTFLKVPHVNEKSKVYRSAEQVKASIDIYRFIYSSSGDSGARRIHSIVTFGFCDNKEKIRKSFIILM